MRETTITRNTAETRITLSLSLDGGETKIQTGCGFLDHMLTLFSRHGHFGLILTCDGDTEVDYHHTTEDIGIVLGQAFKDTLGDMRGILRYSHIILPMDEALILAAVDISGRAHLSFDAQIPAAQAVRPPEKIPKNPCSAIAFLTPFARRYPNPLRGTVAPAPAKSISF